MTTATHIVIQTSPDRLELQVVIMNKNLLQKKKQRNMLKFWLIEKKLSIMI